MGCASSRRVPCRFALPTAPGIPRKSCRYPRRRIRTCHRHRWSRCHPMLHQLDQSEHYLTRDEERLLLRIARDALSSWVTHQKRIELDPYALTVPLREKHGAFVTLRASGELRGCIG